MDSFTSSKPYEYSFNSLNNNVKKNHGLNIASKYLGK